METKFLLVSGILAPLVYLATDRIAGALLKGYSFSAGSMSELGAAGSPVRPLVVALSLISSALMIAFGIGAWQAAGSAILARLVAVFILGNTVFGLIATLFFPNHYGVRPEFATPEVLVMALSVLCSVLAIIFGALAFPGWFRVLSIAIPAAFVLLAILRFATASTSGATVLIGVQERTMSYTFQAWTIALAIELLLSSYKGVLR